MSADSISQNHCAEVLADERQLTGGASEIRAFRSCRRRSSGSRLRGCRRLRRLDLAMIAPNFSLASRNSVPMINQTIVQAAGLDRQSKFFNCEERRRWHVKLIAVDDAFQSMRGKYFRAADLIAEMRLRKRLRIRVPRKFQRADNRILLLADLVDARSRRLRPPSPPSTRVAERAVTEDVTKTPALDSSFR